MRYAENQTLEFCRTVDRDLSNYDADGVSTIFLPLTTDE